MALEDALPRHEMTDILKRAFAGDRTAARSLTERILLPVLDVAVTRMLLGPRGQRFEKNDVIQEVFQHLYENGWRRLQGFDPDRGSLTNYVWAIADGWIRDHSRRRPPPEPAEELEKDLPPDSGPEGKAQLAEVIDQIRDTLNQDELALFQWVYLEGVSHDDIRERLGLGREKLEAVHKRVQRMEAKVRAILQGGEGKKSKRGDAS